MEITRYNLIDTIFNDCLNAIEHIDSTTAYVYHIKHDDQLLDLKIESNASIWRHQSYQNQPYPTSKQIIDIFIYVIAETKQMIINEIRNGISDILLTVESIISNPKYYKKIQHSIIKYGYEFELYITIELM